MINHALTVEEFIFPTHDRFCYSPQFSFSLSLSLSLSLDIFYVSKAPATEPNIDIDFAHIHHHHNHMYTHAFKDLIEDICILFVLVVFIIAGKL